MTRRRTANSEFIRDALPFDLDETQEVSILYADLVLFDSDHYREDDDYLERFLDDNEPTCYDGYDLDPI